MRVIEKSNFSLHNPTWRFTLGPETYETKDTPRRVEAIRKALAADGRFEFATARQFPSGPIARLHPYHGFIKRVSAIASKTGEEIYPDLFPGEGARIVRKTHPLWGGLFCTDAVTPIMARTYEVARGSAEAAMAGAEMLLEGACRDVYALCRPAGHHAGPRVFGGYCYFNNAAVAADILSARGRVAMLDIDYHHGNGTQEFFESRKDVFTCSIHADPASEYPYFWGYRSEKGRGRARGSNLNLPLPKGTDGAAYLRAVGRALGAIRRFAPAFLVVGTGFDTHRDDPIGGFGLTVDVFEDVGKRLARVECPVLFCQEGGYNLEVLGASAHGLLAGFDDARRHC